jgi:hypothetical protein
MHQLRIIAKAAALPEAEPVSLKAMKRFLNVPITTNENDDLIASLITAARQKAEGVTWRSLCKKDYVQYMSGFPGSHHDSFGSPGHGRIFIRHNDDALAIKLRNPPLISVEKITYIDLTGTAVDLVSGTDFQVDFASEPGRVAPNYGNFWPLTAHRVENAVRIFYTAGYEVNAEQRAASEVDNPTVDEPETETVEHANTYAVNEITVDRSVPEMIVTAIKQLVKHWYDNRSPVIATAGAGGHFAPLPLHVEEILNAESCREF